MVAFDGSGPCERAEAYYHDLLADGDNPAIPGDVIGHVRQCERCRQRLECLRETLLELERDGEALQAQEDRNLVCALEAQFELLGEPLTCARVKRFLPGLLAPETPIRIPTPVTVHVDQCPECAEDLESLRALDLDSERLARLGRLYADSTVNDSGVCLRVGSRTILGRRAGPERADARVADHLCICPRCRRRLYQQREKSLERERSRSIGEATSDCAVVSDADLFDFAVPYGNFESLGADAPSGRHAEHIRSCPHCLAKVQQLHRVVYGVLERPNSGLVTVYRTRSSRRRSEAEAESPYGDYPVEVQVIRREADEPVRAHSRIRGWTRLKPVFRTALTAAAVIPVVVLFVMSARSALALTPRRLNEIAVTNPCVHVTVYGEDSESVKQEVWVSSTDGLFISRRGDLSIIFDLTRKRRTVIEHREGRHDVEPLDDTGLAAAKGEMETLLGVSAANPIWNVELKAVGESRLDGVPVNEYESDRENRRSGGASGRQKWKFYVDAVTGEPLRVELFGWEPSENRPVLQETRCFKYPAAGAVRRQAETLQAFE